MTQLMSFHENQVKVLELSISYRYKTANFSIELIIWLILRLLSAKNSFTSELVKLKSSKKLIEKWKTLVFLYFEISNAKRKHFFFMK